MSCPREHIHRLGPNEMIALFAEQLDIAGKGGGIAGDVADRGDTRVGEGVEQRGVRALARGIEYGGVEALAPGQEAGDLFGGVAADEAGVVDVVDPGVAPGVFDGGLNDFDAQGGLGVSGGGQGDGARAAVGVQQLEPAAGVDARGLKRLFIEYFGLPLVDLEEGLGRNLKVEVEQPLRQGRRARDQGTPAVQRVGIAPVQLAVPQGFDFRQGGGDALDGVGEGRVATQHGHDLATTVHPGDEKFQVAREVPGVDPGCDGVQQVDALSGLGQAVVERHDPLAAALEGADDRAPVLLGDGVLGLVAGAVRVRAAQRVEHRGGLKPADAGQGIVDHLALELQGPIVAHVLPLAAAAGPGVGAVGGDAVRGGRRNANKRRLAKASLVAYDLNVHGLAGNGPGHEYGPAVRKTAHALQFRADARNLDPLHQ